MADIFISYSKQDPEPTRKLAHELQELGYSVWWDTNLVAGANFRQVILKELADAKAVIVIWTPASVSSEWVVSEAERAKRARKLVPLRVPALGPHDIPMPFDTLHTEVIGDMSRLVQSLTVLGAAPPGRIPASLPSAVPQNAREFLNRNTYYNNGEVDRAIAEYNKAIEFDPKFAAAYNSRGMAWSAKGDQDRAIADYSQVIELDPKLAAAYTNRGMAWRVKGDQDRAIADFSQAIEIDPKYAFAYTNRGMAWRVKGDQDRAIADFSQAIALDPKDVLAYTNRGNAWHAKGDLDRAIAEYNKAIEIDPKYALAYTNRGIAWRAKGDQDRAIADYSQAIEIDPKYVFAYFSRGLAFERMGRREESVADFRRVLSIDPSHQASNEGLRRLGVRL